MQKAVPGRSLAEQGTFDKVEHLIKEKGGIRLDVGAGHHQHTGFVTMDRRAVPGIDVVHDLESVPWPFPDACVQLAVMSHVVEHISQKYIMEVMDELWRVMKVGGQLLIATPYAGTPRFWQDPTHTHGWTEKTPHYWDPACPMGANCTLYDVYKPLPWAIELVEWESSGDLNIRMAKRPLAPED